jgi:hypothetical protein
LQSPLLLAAPESLSLDINASACSQGQPFLINTRAKAFGFLLRDVLHHDGRFRDYFPGRVTCGKKNEAWKTPFLVRNRNWLLLLAVSPGSSAQSRR